MVQEGLDFNSSCCRTMEQIEHFCVGSNSGTGQCSGRRKKWPRHQNRKLNPRTEKNLDPTGKSLQVRISLLFSLRSLKLVYNIICFFITGPVNTEIIEEVDESGRPKQVNKSQLKLLLPPIKKILIKLQPFTYFSVAN